MNTGVVKPMPHLKKGANKNSPIFSKIFVVSSVKFGVWCDHKCTEWCEYRENRRREGCSFL